MMSTLLLSLFKLQCFDPGTGHVFAACFTKHFLRSVKELRQATRGPLDYFTAYKWGKSMAHSLLTVTL